MTLTAEERRRLEARAAELDERTRQWDYEVADMAAHSADLNRRIEAALDE
jgi:hypothetical protein